LNWGKIRGAKGAIKKRLVAKIREGIQLAKVKKSPDRQEQGL